MHDPAQQLPKDFLPFDDAIKLIQAETRSNPRVDISFMANNIGLGVLVPRHTFQIPLLGVNPKTKKIERIGIRYVYLKNEYEATILEHTINNKYEELARQKFALGVKKVSSVVDDTNNMQGNLIEDSSSSRMIGDEI